MTPDAIASLPGKTVTVYTTSETKLVGRVDEIVGTAAGDPSAITVTLEGGGTVIVPWHAITEITVTP